MKKTAFFLTFILIVFSCKNQKSEEKKEAELEGVIERKSTKSANVSILEKEFIVENLNNISHKVWVYLPPDYNSSTENYPVIYMHDAQNLFDDKTSFVGEWEIDESLNKLYKESGKGFIAVGVENGGEKRIEEYTPWKHKKYGGGKGEIYVIFLAETLKPYIDKNYRTKPERENTAIVGSSLGGLISFYAGLQYSDVFGKVGALSTSFWFSDKINSFTKEKGDLKNTKIYFLVGEKEGEEMVEGTKNTVRILKEGDFPEENIKAKFVPNGEHNEAFWRSEFLETITFLFNL